MTQHDKAPELVERLKVVARCGTDSTMRHFAYASMAQDPDGDYVTYSAYAALAEENRRLREALTHGLSFAESWVDEHGGIDGCEMQDRISMEKIRAALVGGRGR